MNSEEMCRTTPPHGCEERAAGELSTDREEQAWCYQRGFTRSEWRRLVFMRWLWQQGRLTEYPSPAIPERRPGKV